MCPLAPIKRHAKLKLLLQKKVSANTKPAGCITFIFSLCPTSPFLQALRRLVYSCTRSREVFNLKLVVSSISTSPFPHFSDPASIRKPIYHPLNGNSPTKARGSPAQTRGSGSCKVSQVTGSQNADMYS